MRQITILGSTGYIGQQTLEVAEKGAITVAAITGNRNLKLLEQQTRKFKPKYVVTADLDLYSELKIALADTTATVMAGDESLRYVAALEQVDTVVAAIVGIAALSPIQAAVVAGKKIALANKEAMVAAGGLLNRLAQHSGAVFIPVDSEHSAIYQCLMSGRVSEVKRIILTCSGGPFFGMTRAQMSAVTPQQALKHPNWSMGAKITIDSATLMNKGLEVIEAVNLFNVSPEKVDVLIHRQSIIHSMVEFIDNSCMAQMGAPDMKVPIGLALHQPHRVDVGAAPCVFPHSLTLEPPDMLNFPCLQYAYDAVRLGKSYPIVLNAANEAAVMLFLKHKIGFTQIFDLIEKQMSHDVSEADDLDTILEISSFIYESVVNEWR